MGSQGRRWITLQHSETMDICPETLKLSLCPYVCACVSICAHVAAHVHASSVLKEVNFCMAAVCSCGCWKQKQVFVGMCCQWSGTFTIWWCIQCCIWRSPCWFCDRSWIAYHHNIARSSGLLSPSSLVSGWQPFQILIISDDSLKGHIWDSCSAYFSSASALNIAWAIFPFAITCVGHPRSCFGRYRTAWT